MYQLIKKWTFVITLVLLPLYIIFMGEAIVQANPPDGSAKQWIQQTEDSEQMEEEIQKTDEGMKPTSLDYGLGEGLKMIGALIFVVALLYFLLKFVNKKSQSYAQNRIVQHLGGTALGSNRSVQIVKAGRQILILGVGEDVQLLREITDEEERTEIIRQYDEQREKSLEPSNLISTWLKVWKERRSSTQTANSDKPFHSHLHEQLEAVKKGRRSAINKLNEKESNSDE